MRILFNKQVLGIALGSIMSVMSIPSTTTTIVVASSIASLSMTTDVYAKRTGGQWLRKAMKHLKKATDAYENGNLETAKRQIAKGSAAMERFYMSTDVMVDPKTGKGDLNGRG